MTLVLSFSHLYLNSILWSSLPFFFDHEQDPFPLEAVCGHVWQNGEGQLSFLKHAVSAPPELFTFAHSLRKQVILLSWMSCSLTYPGLVKCYFPGIPFFL